MKSGPLTRRCGTGAERERWIELKGKRLYSYKEKPGSDAHPLVCVDLGGALVEAHDEQGRFGVKITGPMMSKTYTLFAKSDAERNEWLESIQSAKDDGSPALEAVGDPSDDEAPKKVSLDDFDVMTLIGEGSFGKVLQVRHKGSGEVYAMKVMSKDVIRRENLVDHTKAEKNILMRIKHPFIVKLHFAFQTASKLYLILDFLSGGEVFYHLSECQKFPEEQARFYTAQLGLALGYLHSLKIIYRDLKPENCVLDKDGYCCLTDFGLAKPGIQGQDAKTFCGTPEYLAPEFLTGAGHGKAVDWWSLGGLLYEMCTGLPPFYSENVNEMYELILSKPLTFEDTGMSEDCQALCRRLLDRDPDTRLQEVEEFKAHPFFTGVDWELMLAKKLPAPFTPDPNKLHVDAEFTSKEARLSTADAKAVPGAGTDFENFTFCGK